MQMGISINMSRNKFEWDKLFAFFLLGALCSCHDVKQHSDQFSINMMETHCKEGGEPNLFVSESNEVYLSWIEYIEGSEVELRFSKLGNNQWTNPKTVSSGNDWFVNWADFPSLISYGKDQTLAAHWLQKSTEGTYDYDIHISQSFNKGQNWESSFILHKDGVTAEHGFVSILPFSQDRVFATWLDGRNTKNDVKMGENDDPHGHHGAMSLRGATFDHEGFIYDDTEIDNRVCDCCQTSAAMTGNGPVVVYRNRSENEIRDIYIARNIDGKWQAPHSVFIDDWYIPGCPVNGPVVKAKGNKVVVAWFSMANDSPEVKVAFSYDGGANFDLPIRVDEGDPLGRVDLVLLSNSEVLVSWMESNEDEALINIARVDENKRHEVKTVSQTKSSRQSGFPQMVINHDNLIMAWTVSDTISTSIKSAWISLDQFIKT